MFPVAVGGIGGSGTRVVAALLEFMGVYIGDDLNEARDNLWFTLLFKRRSILLEPPENVHRLLQIFFARMSGNTTLSDEERALVFGLAVDDRVQHPASWLEERARSFCSAVTSRRAGQSWGWKEPNTHVVLDRIFASHPDLRYIHVTRHPVAMAFSRNQNQLQNWGAAFLNGDVAITPRWSLSYWCAAHRRVTAFMAEHPGRVMMLDFEALCREPDEHYASIARFLGAPTREETRVALRAFVKPPAPADVLGQHDLGQFAAADLAYIRELGYVL